MLQHTATHYGNLCTPMLQRGFLKRGCLRVVLFKGNAVAPIDHTLYGTLGSERLHVGNCTGNSSTWGILCESECG